MRLCAVARRLPRASSRPTRRICGARGLRRMRRGSAGDAGPAPHRHHSRRPAGHRQSPVGARFGSLGLAISSVDIGDHGRVTAAPRSVSAGIGPDLTDPRSPAPGIEDRCRGLISEQPLGSSQSLEDVIVQGAQIPGRSVDPVCTVGAVQLDALPA